MLALALLAGCSSLREAWPPLPDPAQYAEVVARAQEAYRAAGIDYRKRLVSYEALGDYLNYGTTKYWREGPTLTFDAEGLPKRIYPNGAFYNPVLIAEFALTHHGRYLATGDGTEREQFLRAAAWLLGHQDASGALRYDFAWRYYLTGETFAPGWVSGMAQGMALSVFARAYDVTGDARYLEAGAKALEFLLTPVEQGGTLATLADLDPSLGRYLIFEEYVTEPASYTLNGYMFTLLGLYDWSTLEHPSAATAQRYFTRGLETLRKILPYYDLGGITTYDLGYLTHEAEPHVSISYHAVHIYLLHALYTVTQDPLLQRYRDRWASYVD